MSGYSSVVGGVVFLLHFWMTHTLPTSLSCPIPCLCHRGPLLNCSSLGLTKTPLSIPATAVSLNISHNALRSLAPLSSGHVKFKGLLHLWVGSNSLGSLDLAIKKNGSEPASEEQECKAWAPDLQLLSVERNQLNHLPTGLRCLKFLQILQLSYNQISEIGPFDLTTGLKELYLQHNHIRNINSQAFIHLKQLEVLDLSYNLLANIPVPAYKSLRSLNAFVNISFNSWKCDCNLKSLRRWISFDAEVGDSSWKVVCDSPSHHAGKDLLHLEDSDLTCPTHEYSTSGRHHNMIVDEGMQILVTCHNESQDSMPVHWWTPHGQVTDNQPQLLIKDMTEHHEGLYICVSGLQGEHISIFYLQVNTKGRNRRRREAQIKQDERVVQVNTNVPRNNPLVRQGTRTNSEFALAVCLSVFITFIVAFILGVLLRPLLDKLWRRIRSKRPSSPSPTNSRASSTGPQPYVNEGYSDAGDPERVVRVGSRVTFGEITEVGDQGSNVPYYVTVEDVHSDGSSESNTEVENVYELTEKMKPSEWREKAIEMDHHRGRANSISSSSTQEGEVNVLVTTNKSLATNSNTVLEFEPIPDEDVNIQPKSRRSSKSSSSSSSSSHSGQTLDRKLSSEVWESIEQSVDPFSQTKTTEIKFTGFNEEPFTRWPEGLTEQKVDNLDTEIWNDSGESFSFNEDSERDFPNSALGSPVDNDDELNYHGVGVDIPFGKEVSVDDVKQNDTSSSSSSSENDDSEGPNSYTVNPELQEQSEILKESYKKKDSESWIPEDAPFDESQRGAGIFIRQETITLDPSEIHLTFTREDSDDEGLRIDDSQRINQGVFVSWKDVSVNTLPKVKRYVQFKQSKPQSSSLPSLSPSSTKNNVTPDMVVKTEAKLGSSPGEASYVTQAQVSKEIPKVKRYIHFKPSEPHAKTLLPTPSSINKDVKVQARISSISSPSTSEDEGKLSSEEEIFCLKTDVSFTRVPKVKRYIHFKQSELHTPTLPPPPTSTNKGVKVEARRSSTSSSSLSSTSEDEGKLSSEEDTFFMKTDVSSKGVSKVKRYITFKKSEPHAQTLPPPPPSSTSKDVKVEARLSGTSSSSTSEDEGKLSSEKEKFFMKTEVSPMGIPKVKRYIHFKQSEPQAPTLPPPSPSTNTDIKVEARLSITSTSEDEGKLSSEEEKFFMKTDVPPNGVLKVKRYVHFKQSEPNATTFPSPPSSTNNDVKLEARRYSTSSSSSSEDEHKIMSEEDKFFKKTDVSTGSIPKVKQCITFKQIEPSSPNLSVSSPLSKIIPQTDQRNSSNFSPEGLPLYHVHPAYRISQKRDHDTDRSSSENSSEDEDTFLAYPRKLEIKTEADIKRESLTSNINTDTVINIDFDNSSSSTDVFERKQLKGLARLKLLGTRLFNRHENESASTAEALDLSYKMHSMLAEDKVQQTSSEDSFFGNVGLSFNQLKKPTKSLLFTVPNPQFPDQLSFSASGNSGKAHDEGGISSDHEEREKRSSSLTAGVLPTNLIAKTESRRSSSSSQDDVKQSTDGKNFYGLPKVKRYIEFSCTKTSSITQPLNKQSFPPKVVTPLVSRRSSSSSSSEEVMETSSSTHAETNKDVKVEVRRSSTSSSEDEGKLISVEERKIGVSSDRVSKVNRYITFKQFESISPTLAVSSPLTKTEVAVVQSLKSSSSSEDEVSLTPKENEFDGQTGVSFDRVPQVKRYLQFKPTLPHLLDVPPSTTLNTLHVTPENKTKLETRKSSSSSEDDVDAKLPSNDNMPGETDKAFVKVPKVNRYVEFTQSKDSVGFSSVQSIKVKEAKLAKIYVEPTTSVNTTESRRLSSPAQDDVKATAMEDNYRGIKGIYLDKIPKVKRYIKFTLPEHNSPTQSTTSQSSSKSKPIQETRRLSNSSEEDVKPSTDDCNVLYKQNIASFNQLPKVGRYIEFKQHKSSFPDESHLNRLSMTSNKTFSTYSKARANVETSSSSSSPEASPPGSIKTGSVLLMKTGSDSMRSEFHYEEDIKTKQQIVEQTSLKPELKKSAYYYGDSRDSFGHVVMDKPPPQNHPPAVPQTPPPFYSEQENAKEYLRDNSSVRQRQERRRLLQQRRKVMEEFGISSMSSITQEVNRQEGGTWVDQGGASVLHSENASMANSVTYRHTEEAEVPVLQGLKMKNSTARRSKSPVDSADTKYKEFLI